MELVRGGPGNRPLPCLENALEIVKHDPIFGGLCEWGVVHLGDRPITNVDLTEMRAHVARVHGVRFPKELFLEAVFCVATQRPMKPVWDRLVALGRWDGKNRIPRLCEIAGMDSDHAPLLTLFLRSAVVRAREPGSKVDTCMVLFSPQGYHKSQFLEALAMEKHWYTGTPLTFSNDKDVYLNMLGKWIVELPEIEYLIRRRGADGTKILLSDSTNRFRPPYAAVTGDYPRTAVMVGTTNSLHLYPDVSGSRRFLTIPMEGRIKLPEARSILPAVWAQVRTEIESGAIWWPTGPTAVLADEINGRFTVLDNAAALRKYVKDKEMVPFAALDAFPGRNQEKAAVLQSLGYERQRVGPKKLRMWVKV